MSGRLGHHDVSLDPTWWRENLDKGDDEDPDEPLKALQLFHAERAYGLYFLQEGTNTFTLSDNQTFSIYTSPYTPEFNGYAFAYGPDQDRFGPGAREPIPRSGIDIVMTHGPPLLPASGYQLDINRQDDHCGCPMLYEEIRDAKPKMYCFGHLHGGYGVRELAWGSATGVETVGAVCRNPEETVVAGNIMGRTLLINAAIMNDGGKDNNRPWLVNMDLG